MGKASHEVLWEQSQLRRKTASWPSVELSETNSGLVWHQAREWAFKITHYRDATKQVSTGHHRASEIWPVWEWGNCLPTYSVHSELVGDKRRTRHLYLLCSPPPHTERQRSPEDAQSRLLASQWASVTWSITCTIHRKASRPSQPCMPKVLASCTTF